MNEARREQGPSGPWKAAYFCDWALAPKRREQGPSGPWKAACFWDGALAPERMPGAPSYPTASPLGRVGNNKLRLIEKPVHIHPDAES
jgi:hypothetical protein